MPEIARRDARRAEWMALAALVIALFANATTYASGRRFDNHLCGGQNQLRAAVRDSLHRAQHSIPTVTYYKEHPVEKARALENIREQLKTFEDLDC